MDLLYLSFVCGAMFVLQPGLLDASIFCESNFLLLYRLPVTSHVIFNMFISSVSGIPSSAGLSPGITKNLHLAFLPSYHNLTLHTPDCSGVN